MTIADIRKSLIPEEDNEENPFEDATQSSARVTLSRRAGDKTNKTEATEEMVRSLFVFFFFLLISNLTFFFS